MHEKSVLWIGCRDRPEFCTIANSVEKHSPVVYRDELPEIGEVPVGGLVVVASRRRGEFDQALVDELARRHTQTQFVYLLGEWCCGSKRLSKPTVASHIYVHELQGRTGILRLLEDRTQSIDRVRDGSSQLIAIYARSNCSGNALSDAFQLLPMKTVHLQFGDAIRSDGVNFVVWETDLGDDLYGKELRELRGRHPDAQVIALVTYPREYEVRPLRDAGVEVVARPFALNDLFSIFGDAGDFAVRSAA